MKVNEIFLSIQGEGMESGLPTIFIRMSGCNLRCSWCDTKYAYYEGKEMELSKILEKCKKFNVKRVCITGGEPLIQKQECIKLTKQLLKEEFNVLIETNGSISISKIPKRAIISLDIKCPSSKMNKEISYDNLYLIKRRDQVKFIIGNNQDYNFAKKIINKFNLDDRTNVIFQPVYNKLTKSLIKNILNDKLNVRLGLQLHKFIWDANQRAV